jgi:hypothetical protein
VYGAGLDSDHHLLVAAKQFGIHRLEIVDTDLPIQNLVEFCRDNGNLKVLDITDTTLLERGVWTFSEKPPDSSASLALDKLTMNGVMMENSTVATEFCNFIAHVTYTELGLGRISMGDEDEDEDKKKEIARMHFVSELIQPSVQQLKLRSRCRYEVMHVIEACATVTRIQHNKSSRSTAFNPPAVQYKLQTITTRNRDLARFVTNPRAYPGEDLLALMGQCDKCPTGRYMLARCFPGIPSFFNMNGTDASKAGVKKRKRISWP